MINKLVVIINSLKNQKLRKFYYMKWNFLYKITAASRTPDYRATASRSLFSLSSVLNWICWTPPPPEKNSWVRHWRLEQRASKNYTVQDQKNAQCCYILFTIKILQLQHMSTLFVSSSRSAHQLCTDAAEITPTFWRAIKIKQNKVHKKFFYL